MSFTDRLHGHHCRSAARIRDRSIPLDFHTIQRRTPRQVSDPLLSSLSCTRMLLVFTQLAISHLFRWITPTELPLQ
jgi:hypothetical protein